MFKRKDKKESTTSGGTSTHHETTTVQKLNNGTTITQTKQVSSTTYITKTERSVSLVAGSGDELRSIVDKTSPFGLSNSRSFGGNSTPFNTSLTASSRQKDATPFSTTIGPKSSFSNSGSPSSNRIPARPQLTTTSSSSSTGYRERYLEPLKIRTATKKPTVDKDALPFNTGSTGAASNASGVWSRTTTPSYSYPIRLRQPGYIESLLTQNAAQNPAIAQSVPASERVVPSYSIKNLKLGKALVINNIKFHKKEEERKGAKKDSEDLSILLKKIGFEVKLKYDMKGKDMFREVQDFSKTSFAKYDISLVIIMSHGNNVGDNGSRIRGGYTEIAGIDNETCLTEDIIEQFISPKTHYSLKGKPKMFIFQCCRGDLDQKVCTDATPTKQPQKEYADILVAFSTLPGYLSNRDPKTGTWYIQSLCSTFERHYKKYHVEDMLKIVDSELGQKHPSYTQTSTYESRGFKQCYLFKDP